MTGLSLSFSAAAQLHYLEVRLSNAKSSEEKRMIEENIRYWTELKGEKKR